MHIEIFENIVIMSSSLVSILMREKERERETEETGRLRDRKITPKPACRK